ncbi:hypothetical protein GCM10010842_37340 [Deinococcus daejeonensis]|uniref:Uncharacterized protein n=1 Tax=Deinococcus daejeonensis TaxID=1007098 RepID=A0ABQ2JGX1_9DEIO|nr:hypothetical protein GCM10010842_37340 [Deinococcus daejeonensis]
MTVKPASADMDGTAGGALEAGTGGPDSPGSRRICPTSRVVLVSPFRRVSSATVVPEVRARLYRVSPGFTVYAPAALQSRAVASRTVRRREQDGTRDIGIHFLVGFGVMGAGTALSGVGAGGA